MRSARSTGQAALALALVLAAGCSAENGEAPAGRGTALPSTTVVAPSPSPPEPVVPGSLGTTRVVPKTYLPIIDVEWTTHELEIPASAASDLWLSHVSVDGMGTLTAVAFSWDATADQQTVVTWRSADGSTWTRSDLALETGDAMHQAIAVNDAVIGLGQRVTRSGAEALVWTMNDVGTWNPVDFSRSDVDLSAVTAFSVVGNSNGIVIGAERDLDAPRPPISFETKGFRFELRDLPGVYELVDIATERVVTSGASADLFRWSDEGQAIFDLETGELLTTVPWDVWEGSGPSVSPLPIPSPEQGLEQPVVVVWDGYEITIDQLRNRFDVVGIDTSVLVASGTLNDLFRGPAPVFFDSESGEVVLSFTWERWDELMNLAYQAAGDRQSDRHVEQLALFSRDGREWTTASLPADLDVQFDSLVATGDEFVAAVVDHGGLESTRSFFRSVNGTDWAPVDQQPFTPMVPVGVDDLGMIGLSYEDGGSILMTSSDGRSWTPELQMETQDDGATVWLQLAAAGAAGRVAIAAIDPPPYDGVFEITIGSRTATFGQLGSVVEITDAMTGETIRDISDEDVQNGDTPSVTYEGGATMFWSPDGSVLMTISDGDAVAAMDAQAAEFEAAVRSVAFVEREGEWFEAQLPDLGGGFVAQLSVGTDAIVMGVMTGGDLDREAAGGAAASIAVGRIRDP